MDMGDWLAFLWQVTTLTVITAIVTGALFGAVVARWARFPLWIGILTGVLVPILGPVIAAIVAAAKRRGEAMPPVGVTSAGEAQSAGRVDLVWLGVAAAVAAIAVFVPWFQVRLSAASPSLYLPAWGHGVDVALYATIILLAVALGLLFVKRRSMQYVAAVIAIPVASFWAFMGLAVVFFEGPLDKLLHAIGGVSVTVGTVLDVLKLSGDAATVTLPDGVDPGILGLDGPQIDLSKIDIGDFVPDLAAHTSIGWYLALALAALVAVWVVMRVAVRRERPTRAAAAVAPSAPIAEPLFGATPAPAPYPFGVAEASAPQPFGAASAPAADPSAGPAVAGSPWDDILSRPRDEPSGWPSAGPTDSSWG